MGVLQGAYQFGGRDATGFGLGGKGLMGGGGHARLHNVGLGLVAIGDPLAVSATPSVRGVSYKTIPRPLHFTVFIFPSFLARGLLMRWAAMMPERHC